MKYLALCLVAALVAGSFQPATALTPAASVASGGKCDVAAYARKFGTSSTATCIATEVAKRCNAEDACQFGCQISGSGDNIGSGCDHLCHYGRNFALPAGVEACKGSGVDLTRAQGGFRLK